MGEGATAAEGPDFSLGVAVADMADGAALPGRVGAEPALLIRRGDEFFAIGALCTHYQGPLAEGLVVGDTIRCPWHHACFSLRDGSALRAPALDPIPCWRTERRGDLLFATDKIDPARRERASVPPTLGRVVVIGGGAAGLAAAHELREAGYSGSLILVSADAAAPYDRPNLSKDYLAGAAPEDWLPLRPRDYYENRRIELMLATRVRAIDPGARLVCLEHGEPLRYDALLLATGAEPVRLQIPGAERTHVHYLRSLADSRAIIAAAAQASRVAVIGASFIGLEAAAALRERGLEVHVVAPDATPMQKTLGEDIGRLVRAVHEAHGAVFHLGETVASIGADHVALASGTTIDADLVVVGVGVRPLSTLAEEAGLAMDRGVLVDEYLETSAPGVFAAGDIARWPDRRSGERIRIEHFVTAERQGQTAARNILGAKQRFEAAPFFWSRHYDMTISYVGHARAWDRVEIAGSVENKDCVVTYFCRDHRMAVATIGRDLANLHAEVELEESTGG
ncbi:MAG TPA: FAD-dependent oxidoreductase [Methylosinus sp.]|jgi:NADPH-dependent 2,4-dienoyl-CoA reductase/sulfur reductase-like enzyme/nitrite reductase/ring-hydroxylating ferredoxin subunit|uniref:FAD-dependent oxidoreductase n=1 Tax=Methylosinus sp. TaxID=427 RepID=UPI002F943A5A